MWIAAGKREDDPGTTDADEESYGILVSNLSTTRIPVEFELIIDGPLPDHSVWETKKVGPDGGIVSLEDVDDPETSSVASMEAALFIVPSGSGTRGLPGVD